MSGEDDDLDDGNQLYNIVIERRDERRHQATTAWTPPDVEVTNADDETAGITVNSD